MRIRPSERDSQLHVKAWMSQPRHHVEPTALADEAFRLMHEHHVRHLLVMNGPRIVGVVTDRDLRQPPAAQRPRALEDLYVVGRKVAVMNVMTTRLVTVEEDDSTAYAARLMIDNGVGCLPVMRESEVVGILTRTDLMRALAYAVDPETTWDWDSERRPQA
jgi:acetoin utilization protein AcuB